MTIDLAPTSPIGRVSVKAAARTVITVHRTLAAAESDWRRLESIATLTPYQRFDWIAALLRAGADNSGRLAIAVVSRGGVPEAILPLVIRRRWGVRIAHLAGTRQSNSDWLLAAPEFRLEGQELLALLAEVSRAVGGFSLLALFNQPSSWNGVTNRLLSLGHTTAASHLYEVEIGGATIPYVEDRLGSKRRTNIRRSARRLAEAMGPLRFERVSDKAELHRIHKLFLEQRSARFAGMGVQNIFARAPYPAFFLGLAEREFGKVRPAMVLHVLRAGKEVVATSWGTMANDHYSQFINSTEGGEAGRYSLMAILVAELMDDLLRSGITSFDMGLGDFDYKTEWTSPQPVFNGLVPLDGAGRIAAGVLRGRSELKRVIKQTPALWRVARWVRLQLFRLRGGR
jgi:CelD/BcsL family acetyltransferase involved in cellulose biosynthesis